MQSPTTREPVQAPEPEGLEHLPLKDLLSQITERVTLLASKEVALARAELTEDLRSQIALAKHLGSAAICAVLGANMLLVAAVLVLSPWVPGWAVALALAVPFLVAALLLARIGWRKRVKKPLDASLASLKEDLEWVKNKLT
ncbi:MAG: phage holin family protein [Acidobacteria bacterium]|nr:phage holin family protein [Acidobacteriota bacterium]